MCTAKGKQFKRVVKKKDDRLKNGLKQGWANFLAQGWHLEVEFTCEPHYSDCKNL